MLGSAVAASVAALALMVFGVGVEHLLAGRQQRADVEIDGGGAVGPVESFGATLGVDALDEVFGLDERCDVLVVGEAHDAAGQVAHAVGDLQPVQQHACIGAGLLAVAADAPRAGGLVVAGDVGAPPGEVVAALEAEEVSELLDRIPGAYEAVQEGLDQARRGLGIPLGELTADE
jgi:hypothetical protein